MSLHFFGVVDCLYCIFSARSLVQGDSPTLDRENRLLARWNFFFLSLFFSYFLIRK